MLPNRFAAGREPAAMTRITCALVALASLAVVLTTSAIAADGPFAVTSTLDGKTVLPHRIHW
jgi:hypothetical protein